MKISTITLGILSAVVLCGQASAVETDYGAGTHSSPLQEAGGTARAAAMGGAVVGVSEGSASLLWNPAGLGRMDCKEVGLHSNTGLANQVQEIAIFGTPLGEVKEGCAGGSHGGLAASFGYVNYGSFNGADANGVQTGNYGATGDLNGSVGYGKEIFPGFSAGATVKEDHSTYANKSYDVLAADVGVLWKVIPSLDLGLVYSNIGVAGTVGGTQLAAGWRLGAGWNVNKHWLLAASGELQDKGVSRAQLGTEFLIGNVESKSNVLALRMGYVLNYPDPQLTGLAGMTFGVGYSVTKSMIVDYAMLPAGELGTSQRLSLTFKWDCPKNSVAAK